MYTSYFALTKKLLENGYKNLVAISGYLPNFYSVQMQNDKRLTRCIELSPKKEWFFKWKNGEFDNKKYEELYYETVLNKLNPDELYNKLGKDAILLCYETPEKFCHRHIVAKWFNENLGKNIKELEL